MPDTLAGRRALEFFGLLAVTPRAPKKDEKVWPQFTASQTKKVAAVQRPRKGK